MLKHSSRLWQVDRFLRSAAKQFAQTRWQSVSSIHTSTNEQLRILFCGSDEFSITSLQAVHDYSQATNSKIESIDVATKLDKRVGRGLTTIKSPPVKDEALKLNLPLHQFDTFRGWSLPEDRRINMVIAVSFGLLVPPRILTACQYGGLNVHPSLLPDLKGSAPIEHAIMHGYRKTGVTVQTLHHSKFDEGQIVLQTPAPGIDIPNADTITTIELKQQLAQVGADMLVRALDEELYLSPLPAQQYHEKVNFAPKLRKDDGRIKFRTTSSTDILRKFRALEKLWVAMDGGGDGGMRLILSDVGYPETHHTEVISQIPSKILSPGAAFILSSTKTGKAGPDSPLFLKTCDDQILAIKEMAVSGQRMGSVVSEKALRKAKLLESESLQILDRRLHLLKQPKA